MLFYHSRQLGAGVPVYTDIFHSKLVSRLLGPVTDLGDNHMIRKLTTVMAALVVGAGVAAAGHHEMAEGEIALAATSGQVVVVYKLDCAEDQKDAGIAIVETLIAYERGHSPIPYSSTLGRWDDGLLGAVDIHSSLASMEAAFEWQANDETWSALNNQMLETCGVEADDLQVSIMVAE